MGEEDDITEIIDEWVKNNPSSNVTVTPALDDISWISDVMFGDNDNDSSYGVTPLDSEREIYTSYEQREQHDKYPALQKAWEDYLAMYALTKGEPPVVD